LTHEEVGGPAVAVGVGDGEGDADADGDALEDGDGNGVGAGDPWLADFPERQAPATSSIARAMIRTTFIGRL
jgi:hypothetical protein